MRYCVTRIACVIAAVLGGGLAAAPPPPRLTALEIPGEPAFVEVARDVLDVAFALDPSTASSAGLFADALRVPSFSETSIERLSLRLGADLAALREMPWRSWPVDRQIDYRWVWANAEALLHLLREERPWVHRPATWLEPFANNLIAFITYRPDETAPRSRLWELLPGMLTEMQRLAVEVTQWDCETARKLLAALVGMASRDGTPEATAALAPLAAADGALLALRPRQGFVVIGAAAYAWRFQHALLLPFTPAQLLAAAEQELARVDAEIETLQATLKGAPPLAPTAAQQERAAALTRESLLALYDDIAAEVRQATVAAGWVTVGEDVGPIRARETPDALVPLTGDGGSLNPPPPFMDFNVGFWNVEHFRADWPAAQRLQTVMYAENWRRNGFGTYTAHEGIPGHHLQLAIARRQRNPLRNVLLDNPMTEGWALYAEEELWRHGGMSDAPESRLAVLYAYRARIARVLYDVNVETGVWTLQQGADFKSRAEPGKGQIDEDLLRSIQWPTQLSGYFSGKRQILDLKEAYRQKHGAAYSERAFHDALLAEGSLPVALIRAKLLGEPVPEL